MIQYAYGPKGRRAMWGYFHTEEAGEAQALFADGWASIKHDGERFVAKISADGLSLEEDGADPVDPWATVRSRRNALLDESAWAVDLDSPLSADAKTAWSSYRKTLHRLTIDYSTADQVAWPEQPAITYAAWRPAERPQLAVRTR